MKRIFVLCIAFVVLVAGVANAKIIKEKDSFTGGTYVGSFIQPKNFFNSVYFRKLMSDGITTYELSILRIRSKDSVFGNAAIEMKIEGQPVYVLSDYRYKLNGPDSYGVKYSSSIEVKISADIADKIKDAKRVAIQFEEANGMRWPYVIPDDVLAEWKEVINATEWDILESINKKK